MPILISNSCIVLLVESSVADYPYRETEAKGGRISLHSPCTVKVPRTFTTWAWSIGLDTFYRGYGRV